MGILYKAYSQKNGENLVEITDTGDLNCFQVYTGVPAASIPNNCRFLIKNSSGDKVAGWDDYGTVYLTGQIHSSVATPLVTQITPTYGLTPGGTSITINGAHFSASTTVTIDGNACTNVVCVNSGQLTCDTPAGTAGYKDVVVTAPNRGRYEMENGFEYWAAPDITSVSPSSGTNGTTISIIGTGFQVGPTVTIGGTAATNIIWRNATKITCRVPNKANGSYDVVVTNTDSQSDTLSNGFEYVTAPSVTIVTPYFGITDGGESVTIAGTGFVDGATITFGGSSATNVSVDSDTQITCDTPGRGAGLVDVVVTNADNGAGTLYDGFEFVSQTIKTLTDDAGADAVEFETHSGQIVFFIDSLGEMKIRGQAVIGFPD